MITEERIFESKKYNYRYLNTEFLTEFKILSIKDVSVHNYYEYNFQQIDFELPDIDFNQILKQEVIIPKEDDEEDKAKYGQYLYEKLETEGHYKVRWDSKDIVIESLRLTLKFPYSLDDFVLHENGKESFLKQIKKQVHYQFFLN